MLDTYPAGVMGYTTVTYYDIHGRTFAEVRADMHRLGPKIADSSFVGETRAPMSWTFRTESQGSGMCSIPNPTVSVNAQITLPRWTPPPDTEPGLAAEWTRFVAALETHEAGHKDISAKAGRDLVHQVRGLSGTCSQIGARANGIARAVVDRATEDQKAYDAATRHGLTQGTAFGSSRLTSSVFDPLAPLTLVAAPRRGTILGHLQVPLERAWAVMPAVYAANDLAINAVDSSAHAVGDSLTVHGRIGGVRASEVIDCGTPPTGPNADSVDVALFVTSRLEVDQPTGSVVANTVQAVAHPSGAPPVTCRSRGFLERQLLDALRGHVTPQGVDVVVDLSSTPGELNQHDGDEKKEEPKEQRFREPPPRSVSGDFEQIEPARRPLAHSSFDDESTPGIIGGHIQLDEGLRGRRRDRAARS